MLSFCMQSTAMTVTTESGTGKTAKSLLNIDTLQSHMNWLIKIRLLSQRKEDATGKCIL